MHRTDMKLTIAICSLVVAITGQANGADQWLTDPSTGARLWNPSPVAGESVEWRGAGRKAEGPGVAIWKVNGMETEQAAGEWIAGRLDGHGVWQRGNGERYEGQWKNGRKHGYGVYTWADGTRFCGRYRADRREAGAFYRADGKSAEANAPSPSARQQAFEAEASAIRARQVAGEARRQTPRINP